MFAQRAPLGDVLEIAAGTGRLAELYVPHSDSALLLDASPESLAIAARRLDSEPRITFLEADIFSWEHGNTFDTIVFSAWLHHVPRSRFSAFWTQVQTLLAWGGRVIFDIPDAEVTPPGKVEIPAEPTEDYGFYVPHDGVSVRDTSVVEREARARVVWSPPRPGLRKPQQQQRVQADRVAPIGCRD